MGSEKNVILDGAEVEYVFEKASNDGSQPAKLSWTVPGLETGEKATISGDNILAIDGPNPSPSIPTKEAVQANNWYRIFQNDLDRPVVDVSNVPEELLVGFQWNFPNKPDYLSIQTSATKQEQSNIHVVISTLSGTQEAKARFEKVIKPALSAYWKPNADDDIDHFYQVHYTQSTKTINELSRDIFLPNSLAGVKQTIVLLSGDGGVHDLLNGLGPILTKDRSSYEPPAVVLLALGTGNALAHSLGLTKSSTLGLRKLFQGKRQALPIFEARFSPGARLVSDEGRQFTPLTGDRNSILGAVVCSYGFHAALVADSDTVEYRKFGAERFQMAAKELLYPSDGSEPHKYRATVSLNLKNKTEGMVSEKRLSSEHSYVLATLVSRLEKAFTISPSTPTPPDGKLRLVQFGPLKGDEIMQLMQAAYNDGKHVEDERVFYSEIIGLRVDFEEPGGDDGRRWRRVCVDGTIVAVEEGGWVELSLLEGSLLDIIV
jgi:diacylglycerol kinase family enzyme